jgi:hypothetical protein
MADIGEAVPAGHRGGPPFDLPTLHLDRETAARHCFSFFDTEAATTTCLETYHFPPDFEYPEPESWYPAPPPRAQR